MALTLSKITKNVATVSVVWGEDTVNVVYYPARVTEKTIQELQTLGTMNADSVVAGYKALNSVLAHLIKSWDLYEDDEATVMYPLTPERLSELPITFRVEVVKVIMGDIRPEAMAPQEKTPS